MTDPVHGKFATAILARCIAPTLMVLALALVAAPLASAQTYTFNRADYATGQGPETLAEGDFNGDGKMDVVVGNTNSQSTTVSVLLGKTDGTFAPAVNYAVVGSPTSVAVGDFNGDGKLDIIAVCGPSDAQVSVLLGKGDGTFKPFIVTTAGPGGNNIAVADFNGDGKLDVAISDNLESTEGVDIMLGNGDGTFKVPVTYATANDPRMVVVADFNGDGKLDLATINSGSETVSLLLGTGTGTFATHTDFATKQPGCVSLAAGDLRNNGKIDLVAGCQVLGQVVVLLGSGTGTLAAAKDYAVPDGVDIVALGDFNGDGKLDVAVTSGEEGEGVVSILAGSGSGKLKAAVGFGTNFGPTALGVADFNGDGKMDVVTADSNSPFELTFGEISVLLSNGKSLLGGRTDYSVATGNETGAYSGIAAADLNGDGKPDLIVPVTFADQLAVLINTGKGAFKSFVTYPLPSSPQAVVAGDFNNDKKIDVAVVNFGSPGSISVLLNAGGGVLSPYTQYPVNGVSFGIATGDFNQDGSLDLVVTDAYENTVSVLLGNATGAFPSLATYPTGAFPMGVAVGDFNHDGFPDLAVANEQDGTISILLNNGDGTFSTPTNGVYTVGGFPISIAAGSLRDNGILDLAVATDQIGIVILLGNNDGTFGKPALYDTPNNAYSVVIGDFSNDGKLDLAVTLVNDGNPGFISVMPGQGDGTFPTELILTTGTLPSGIVAADFNEDGGLDLATANGTRVSGDIGSASVLLNEPVIAMAPTSLNFGNVVEGATSAPMTVALTNPGAAPLKITSIKVSGDFAETNTCPKELTTGKDCSITVTFSPKAKGSLPGTLTIKDSAPTSAQILALSGTGT
jgi:hypothetical protein